MVSSEGSSTTLEYTPTWVVALVCSVIVAISLFAERVLHYLGKLLKYKSQNALYEALQKLKEELMLLGFISLLLTVFQNGISKICIPASVSLQMLPCKPVDAPSPKHEYVPGEGFRYTDIINRRRLLAQSSGSDHCTSQGKVPLLSLEALHELHIFIFVLAVVHVLFSASTMALGSAKIQRWKLWEKSVRGQTDKLEKPTGKENRTLTHSNRQFFSDRAMGFWRTSAVLSWIMAFFKQFYASVTKSDYLALRYGFIMKHCQGNPKFDFHKYMMRTLEDDFRKVIGISWYLWLFVVVFLLLNVNGWHTYFWLSFLPFALLLIVGAKLEYIITRLAQDALSDTQDYRTLRIKPSDDHFWFRKPRIILHLVHFILFQNAFEIAFFFWLLSTYGFDSCIMDSIAFVIPRLVVGVAVQVLCSYSTLPLYALVSQMGESFKKSVFESSTQRLLETWAGKHKRHDKPGGMFAYLLGLTNDKDLESSHDHEIEIQRMAVERFKSLRSSRRPVDDDGITPHVLERSDLV